MSGNRENLVRFLPLKTPDKSARVSPEARVVVGGFTSPKPKPARLNGDGAVELTFKPLPAPNGTILDLAARVDEHVHRNVLGVDQAELGDDRSSLLPRSEGGTVMALRPRPGSWTIIWTAAAALSQTPVSAPLRLPIRAPAAWRARRRRGARPDRGSRPRPRRFRSERA